MSDPTITTAQESGEGSGTLDCGKLSAVERGRDVLRWDNGRISVLKYEDHITPGLSDTRGVVISGEFQGLKIHYVGAAAPLDPKICTSPTAGSVQALFGGEGQFQR